MVGILVEAEERYRAGSRRGILETLSAVAQPIQVDIPPLSGRECLLTPEGCASAARLNAPRGRISAILRRPDRHQVALRVGRFGEVPRQHIKHRVGTPGRNDVAVNQFITIISAILDGNTHTSVNRILVEEFVNPVGIIFDDDPQLTAGARLPSGNKPVRPLHRAGRVNIKRLELLQREGQMYRGVGMLLSGHKIMELAVATQIRGDKVGCDRVGVVVEVEVKGQITNLAGVFHTRVTHLVGEPEIRSVRRVHRRSRTPRLTAGECLAVGDRLLLVLGVGGGLGTAT